MVGAALGPVACSRLTVHEQAVRGREAPGDPRGDRLEMEAGPSRPVAETGAVEGDPLAGMDLRLPAEGKTISDFRDNDL